MEHAMQKGSKRSGWNDRESNLLWETADEAQQQGLPLKQVFERVATQTGRKPNSIRNYYYAQVRERVGGAAHTARFVPFTDAEVTGLMEYVLRARAQGQSVRSCLQKKAGDDHSLMLRYQNKYRSVLKSRPELVRQITERLNAEGIECEPPEVKQRGQSNLNEACLTLSAAAKQTDSAELIRACDILTRLMLAGRSDAMQTEDKNAAKNRMGVRVDLYRIALTERAQKMRHLSETAGELVGTIKDYLSKGEDARGKINEQFLSALTEQIGALEECITEAESVNNDVLPISS